MSPVRISRSVRILRLICGVAALFAAIFLFATYGTTLADRPFAPVALNGPVAADSNGEFSAIADTESRRVLILNADGDLTGVVDCTTIDSPIESVIDVCVVNDRIYIAGVKTAPDSAVIEKERVAVYDKGGNFRGTIYEKKGDDNETPTIKSLRDAQSGVAIVLSTATLSQEGKVDGTLSLVFANEKETRELLNESGKEIDIFAAACDASTEKIITINISGEFGNGSSEGTWSIPNRVFTAVDLGSTGAIYACDEVSGALCVISEDRQAREIVSGSSYEDVHVNNDVVSICDRENDIVKISDAEGNIRESLQSVVPSIGFSIRMLVVWICILYLVALALVFAIRKLRNRLKYGNTEGLGALLASVATIAVIAVAILSLAFSSYEKSVETRTSEISMCADYLTYEAYDLGESMEKCNNRNLFREMQDDSAAETASYYRVIASVASLVHAADENNIGLYFILYGKDDKGIFYLSDSAFEHVLGTAASSALSKAELQSAFEKLSDGKSEIQRGRTRSDATANKLVQIPTSDGTGVAGVIEIGSKIRSFESAITSDMTQRILGLLIMMLVVYLTYSELRACGRCIFSFRSLFERNEREAVATLTRPFTFCITILSSIDGVMTVLIAREMLESAGVGASGTLLALPPIMLGVGMMIGQGLFGAASSRVGLRRLVATGAAFMLLFAVGAVFVVASGNFWLYCVAKLLMAIPFGLLYSLGYSLPRLAENDETRTMAAGGVKRTDTSAAALGTVLGGYTAQILGNAWVYVFVAFACIPVLLMALNMFPKGGAPLESRKAQSSGNVGILRLLQNPATLAIALLVLLPATLASGYASFIFPLFTADFGLTKIEINNLFVLGQLVVYMCIARIEVADGRYGKWRVTVCALAFIGVVFLLFAIRTTLVWSIVVIALVGVLGKSTDGWKPMWLYSADKVGVSPGRATGAMFAARSAALIVQPFILGALVGASSNVVVIVIGVVCVLCALGFFFATRRSELPAMK